MEQRQNVTLSLPRSLVKRVKRIAVDRETSISALMVEALTTLSDSETRYNAARRRAITAMESSPSLGTNGQRTWTRDELHER